MFTLRAATAKIQDVKKGIVNATSEMSHVLINANANNARMIKYIHPQSPKTSANINFIKIQMMLHFKSIILILRVNNFIKIVLMIANLSKFKIIKKLIN